MNEEANRKLLEFAGFYQYGSLWTIEDEDILLIEPPNFFHPELGLGWLFKYLVPKLLSKGFNIHIHIFSDHTKVIVSNVNGTFQKIDKESQVALANAIQKWLESEKK